MTNHAYTWRAPCPLAEERPIATVTHAWTGTGPSSPSGPPATFHWTGPAAHRASRPHGDDEITSEYIKFPAVMAVEGTIVVAVLIGLTMLV